MSILKSTKTGPYFFEEREKEIKKELELRGITNYTITRIKEAPYFRVTISVEDLLAPTNPCE